MHALARRRRGGRRSRPLETRGLLLAWSAAASLFPFGCAGGEARPDLLSSSDSDWCPAICDMVLRCQGGIAQGCVAGCRSDASGYFRRVVPESIEAEAACLRAATECPGDMSTLYADCYEQAGRAVPPSAAADRFCTRMSETFFECAWFGSPDACSEELARFTPEALAAGERCSGTPCAELEQCMTASLFTYGDR
jgi:hypothetical protein